LQAVAILEGDGMQRYIIGILVFALVISVFAVQNAGPVRIKFFFWIIPEIPLVLVILSTALCGLIVGILLACFNQRKRLKGTFQSEKTAPWTSFFSNLRREKK